MTFRFVYIVLHIQNLQSYRQRIENNTNKTRTHFFKTPEFDGSHDRRRECCRSMRSRRLLIPWIRRRAFPSNRTPSGTCRPGGISVCGCSRNQLRICNLDRQLQRLCNSHMGFIISILITTRVWAFDDEYVRQCLLHDWHVRTMRMKMLHVM